MSLSARVPSVAIGGWRGGTANGVPDDGELVELLYDTVEWLAAIACCEERAIRALRALDARRAWRGAAGPASAPAAGDQAAAPGVSWLTRAGGITRTLAISPRSDARAEVLRNVVKAQRYSASLSAHSGATPLPYRVVPVPASQSCLGKVVRA